MGSSWDKNTGPSFDKEFWKEVYRVMKPGAFGIVFGGGRTYHRQTVAIEDGGFEIRDCLYWAFGSGFPKSKDFSKDIKEEVERALRAQGVSGKIEWKKEIMRRRGE